MEINYPSLEAVTRPTLTTDEAAYYLNRKPQTLRYWACMDNGLIRPMRLGGRLAWRVEDLKRVLGMRA